MATTTEQGIIDRHRDVIERAGLSEYATESRYTAYILTIALEHFEAEPAVCLLRKDERLSSNPRMYLAFWLIERLYIASSGL